MLTGSSGRVYTEDCSPGLQLRCTRHRQYGGAREIRHRRSEEAMAHSAVEWRDQISLLDDRAGCCVERCYEYHIDNEEGRQ